MGATVAAKNKKVREQALRDQLSQKQLHTQVIRIADKLDNQHLELEATHISALKASAELKLKLINKYMPDLKAVELSQDPENPITAMTDSELSAQIAALREKLDAQSE